MKFMLLAASLAKRSINRDLINLAEKELQDREVDINHFDFRQLNHIAYNRDIQDELGFPEDITLFANELNTCDGLIIAIPEYNGSIPGHLKNLLDWVSRMRPSPWKEKPMLLMSASPSLMGGVRGLLGARVPFESCGAFVFPQLFTLPSAYDAFDDTEELVSDDNKIRLNGIIGKFIEYAQVLSKN